MKLFLGKPAQAGQMRVERDQRPLTTQRKFEANEQAFRREHPEAYRDHGVAQRYAVGEAPTRSRHPSFGTIIAGSNFPSMASRQFLAATVSMRSAHSRVSEAECGEKITFSNPSKG